MSQAAKKAAIRGSGPVRSPPSSQRLPICVFALRDTSVIKNIERDFKLLNIRVIFVNTVAELAKLQSVPETFLNFVDVSLFPESVKIVANRDKNLKSYWIAVSTPMSIPQSLALYKLGMADILTLPVHPITYRNRAKAVLARYLRLLETERKNEIAQAPVEEVKKATNLPGSLHNLDRKSSWYPRVLEKLKSPLVTGVYGRHKVFESRMYFHEQASNVIAKQAELFKEVETLEARMAYFREISQLETRALIWGTQQRWSQNCRVIKGEKGVERVYFAYPRGTNRGEFKESFEEANAKLVYVSFCLDRVRLFFSVDAKDLLFETDSWSVPMPQLLFQVQRREFFRLALKESLKFRIRITNKVFKGQEFQALNISAGGALVLVVRHQAQFFEVASVCQKVEFEVYGKVVKCAAAVQWKSDANVEDMCKVGLRLVDMDPVDRDGLNLFVMEEAYDYLRRYIAVD